MNEIPKKIIIINLGCSKNLVDSEQLLYHIQANNISTEFNPKHLQGDFAIVNTCGFINDAREESVETILDLIQAKNAGNIGKIIVFGCLSQRYAAELASELPEVDCFIGNYDLEALMQALELKADNRSVFGRTITNSGHYAYVKIAEGCNRKCSFCAIPSIKGNYISRSIDSIAEEVQYLTQRGVSEIMLIAQDSSFFGYDRYKQHMLPTLLKELVSIKNLHWLRVHYLYPNAVDKQLIETIATEPKICNYYDIPFQHANNQVLKRMRRNSNQEKIIKLINNIRSVAPDAAIRTTMIVGYPGETRSEFNDLIKFVRKIQFDRLGAFTYSHEENTYAAKNHRDSVATSVKKSRLNRLMTLQQSISLEKNLNKIGKTIEVIVDEVQKDTAIGRSQYDSVEVDNEVIIENSGHLKVGNYYNVEIEMASDYELFGKVLEY